MNRNVFRRFLSLSLTVITIISLFPAFEITASAADLTGLSVEGVTASYEGGTWKASGNTIIGSVRGEGSVSTGCGGNTDSRAVVTATLTIGGSVGKLGFTYTVTGVDSENSNESYAIVNGTTVGDCVSQSAMIEFTENSNSTTITLSAYAESNTVEITIEGITLHGDDAVKVTINEASNGHVTVNDETVSGEIEGEVDTVIVAIPNSGYTFFGWENASETIVSYESSISMGTFEGQSLTPVFIPTESAIFQVDTLKLYDLNEADAYAKNSSSSKLIVLIQDGTLPAGNYTISSGVTLLIPYDSGNTLCTTTPTVDGSTGLLSASANAWVKPTAFRTLTMADGANLIINGEMSVSGKACFRQGYNGSPTGPLGFVNMKSGSSITVNNGAFLYAWGYITGSGTVTVKSGGTVYEDFQVRDWRGGSAASAMLDKDEKVFPVSQYYVQNVEVPMTLEAGALEYGYMSLVASKVFGETTVPFIGGLGMFRNSGIIVKDYDEDTDRFEVTVDGDLTMSNLNLPISAYNMNSANYVLPITNNLTVTVNSGTTTISQDMCMLPGSEIIVADGATVKLAPNVNFFVYDLAEWENKLFVYSKRDVSPLTYVGAKKGAPVSRALKDAKIVVNGTVDASLGNVYTTSGGANITSDGGGEAIVGTAGSATVTYQYVQSGYGFTEVPITPAKLLNSDNSYKETARAAETLTYTYENGFWKSNAVATIVSQKKDYRYLASAINAYGSDDNYIQMLTDTNENTTIDASNKTVYLDLNGKNVTVTELKVANLYGMDTATNGFTSNAAGQYGEIIGTVSGTVAPNYRYDRTKDVSSKCYVASTTDNKLSFHRFDMGVTDYTFYGSGNTGEMVFNMVFKGDALAKAEILKRGVEFNSSYDWSSESEDTLTGRITNITGREFTIAYTVKAAVMLCDAHNTVFTGDKYFANDVSFQSAMKAVYSEQNKAAFDKFAAANGFSLSN